MEGHHIYKAVWTPVIGEELHTKLEKDNEHDEHTVAVILDGGTVGHLPRTISPCVVVLFKATSTA